MITNKQLALLQQLATEWRETPEQLLERLINKENFERHYVFDAMNGKVSHKTCISLDCFMEGRLGDKPVS